VARLQVSGSSITDRVLRRYANLLSELVVIEELYEDLRETVKQVTAERDEALAELKRVKGTSPLKPEHWPANNLPASSQVKADFTDRLDTE
jgi:hypothetical protein